MSIRNGILALVAERPSHGYQVKTDFEERTGGTWPLNIGLLRAKPYLLTERASQLGELGRKLRIHRVDGLPVARSNRWPTLPQ